MRIDASTVVDGWLLPQATIQWRISALALHDVNLVNLDGSPRGAPFRPLGQPGSRLHEASDLTACPLFSRWLLKLQGPYVAYCLTKVVKLQQESADNKSTVAFMCMEPGSYGQKVMLTCMS